MATSLSLAGSISIPHDRMRTEMTSIEMKVDNLDAGKGKEIAASC